MNRSSGNLPPRDAAAAPDDGALPELHDPMRPDPLFAAEPVAAGRRKTYADPAENAEGRARHADVLPPAARWLAALPAGVRPALTAEHFPRVINLLWSLWRQPPRCREYFDELLFPAVARMQRAGFPAAVLRELSALRQYYEALPPSERER